MKDNHPLIAIIASAERAIGSNPRSAVEQYNTIIADARFSELDAPLRSACHLNRGFQQRVLGRPREALADYDRAAIVAPSTFKPHLNAGLVLAQDLHDFAAAREAFDRAIGLNPCCLDALYSRALVKMELHDNAGAEADLNSALSLAPDDPNALTNLGALQMKRGQLEQAADSFQKALRFAPHDPEIRCNVALALYRLDLNEAALETLRRDTRAIHLWEANGRPQVPPRLSLVFYLVIAASAIAMAVFVAWRLNSTL